jgi:hypothetical protein
MTRKVKISDQDVADQEVRDTAVYYNVVLHIPQRNSKVKFSDDDYGAAIQFAQDAYLDDSGGRVRAAMVYAVNAQERFALMGTTNRFQPVYRPFYL